MNFKSTVWLLVITLLFLIQTSSSQAAENLTAKAAIVIDANHETVFFEKNMHMRLPIASTVKILTAVIVFEQLDLEDQVVITKRAAGIAPSKAYLTEAEKYKVEDLLKCFLMSSANDAGVALAEAITSTEFKFSLLMNKRAKDLGAKDSFFLNATGLPENRKKQHATVYDLSLFMKKFLEYPQLVKIIRTKKAVIKRSDGKNIKLRNHNKFLWRNYNNLIGKTGYTRKAGHCFLGAFTQGKRRLIIAILGSRKLWSDLEYLLNKQY